MVSWLFLSLGLTLGMIWVRRTRLGRLLGAGIQWRTPACCRSFTASAFLHSVIVQERRGMLKVWNVSLVILTFFLTISERS